jgi:hypothetical protein
LADGSQKHLLAGGCQAEALGQICFTGEPFLFEEQTQMIIACAIRDIDTREIFKEQLGHVLHATEADPYLERALEFGYTDDAGNFMTREEACDVCIPPVLRFDE